MDRRRRGGALPASEIVDVASAFAATPDRPQRAVLRPYQGCRDGGDPVLNQFLLLLKPHMLDVAAGVDVARAVDIILATLAAWSVDVSGVVVLSSRYVTDHSLVPRTYGTLNLVARRGRDALSSLATRRLEDAIGEHRHRACVSGAFEFLERHGDFTDTALCVAANNVETAKLSAGSYASLIEYFGAVEVVLNAFHPFQLRTMTQPGTCVVALECWSPRTFRNLRSDMVGGIFPNTAAVGSLRRSLFEARDLTGARDASPQLNYVHISPGPLEAAYHLVTYFSDFGADAVLPLTATNVGALLAADALDYDIDWLAGNPEVTIDGARIPVFDISEDSETAALVNIMRMIVIDRASRT